MIADLWKEVLDAVVEVVTEAPEPVPASIIVVGLQSRGCPYKTANDMVNYLVRTGRIKRSNNLLTAA